MQMQHHAERKPGCEWTRLAPRYTAPGSSATATASQQFLLCSVRLVGILCLGYSSKR